eukprot:986970_1
MSSAQATAINKKEMNERVLKPSVYLKITKMKPKSNSESKVHNKSNKKRKSKSKKTKNLNIGCILDLSCAYLAVDELYNSVFQKQSMITPTGYKSPFSPDIKAKMNVKKHNKTDSTDMNTMVLDVLNGITTPSHSPVKTYHQFIHNYSDSLLDSQEWFIDNEYYDTKSPNVLNYNHNI